MAGCDVLNPITLTTQEKQGLYSVSMTKESPNKFTVNDLNDNSEPRF